MIHKYNISYTLNGQNYQQEMTYADDEVKTTLRRRVLTAFPGAQNIDINNAADPQLPLPTGKAAR